MLLKEIKIGHLIHEKVNELDFEMKRICNFFKCSEKEIEEMYQQEDLMTDVLLKWSKLLRFDFFRLYSQHLVLYAPPKKHEKKPLNKAEKYHSFRKNLYTQEMIR